MQHNLQMMQKLAGQLSVPVSISLPNVPLEFQKRFRRIEIETNWWQQCLQGDTLSGLLIELTSKVGDVRNAISLTLLRFKEVQPSKEGGTNRLDKASSKTSKSIEPVKNRLKKKKNTSLDLYMPIKVEALVQGEEARLCQFNCR
jgi:hypothetical protein